MTREALFRALGEVREDQIAAAEVMKKQARPRRRLGVLAACAALAVTAGALSLPRGQPEWESIIDNFNPGAADAGGGGNAGTGSLDGTDYWTDNPNWPTHPDYSTGVEIGQLSGPGSGDAMMGMSSCTAWLSPEEIFAQDTVIFRGTVRELQYYSVKLDAVGMNTYYTRALVEVTDSIRGNLTEGETYSLLWLGAKGYMTTSLSGPLEELDAGSEAIFMPIPTGRDSGWREGESYFCYADLAELYLGEGTRYVFADTAEGLSFARDVYTELAEAETLDEIAAYIREVTAKEGTQPAAVPAEPQTKPSETADAAPSAPGPAGARELPGGAIIKGE